MNASKSFYFRAEDPQTRRWECIAVSGLGLAGIILIMTAVTDSIQFAQHREAIIQAWSAPGQGRVELVRRVPNQTLTVPLSGHAMTGPTHADTALQTPASDGREALMPQSQTVAQRTLARSQLEALH